MFYYDYPIIRSESKLPIYLINMGLNEWQYHVIRKDGYGHYMFIFCTEGSGTLIIDGKEYIISANMGFYIPPFIPHEYFSNENVWNTHWVVADGFAAEETLNRLGFRDYTVFSLFDIKAVEHSFKKIHEAIAGDSIFGNFRAAGFLYDFLIEMYRQTSSESSSSTTNSTVLKAIDYININYVSPITLDRLCSITSVSRQHLCRLFRSALNCRPMEYVAKRRIQESKELLSNTDKSVEQIAEETGFGNISYFCKLFKRYEGMTPSQFRKG